MSVPKQNPTVQQEKKQWHADAEADAVAVVGAGKRRWPARNEVTD